MDIKISHIVSNSRVELIVVPRSKFSLTVSELVSSNEMFVCVVDWTADRIEDPT